MRFESKLNSLARRIPAPRREIICHWIGEQEIFSTAGWSIGFDDDGNPVSQGDVPAPYTHAYLLELRARRTEARKE